LRLTPTHCNPFQANKYEQILVRRADGISQNLHRALQTHRSLVTDDITTALIEYTRSSIMYERQLLRELESLRPDVASSNAKVGPKTNGIPKPTIIPPLEDDSKPSLVLGTPGPPLSRGPVSASSIPSNVVSGRPGISQAPVPPSAGSSKPPVATPQPPRTSFVSQNISSITAPSQAGGTEPPLGGRFADGTKSMFIQPSSSSSFPSAHVQSSGFTTAVPRPSNTDPLLGSPLMSSDPIQRPGTTDGTPRAASDVDPLGGIRPAYMSASVRVQPTRRRLDAREAASKLANMF
jgi:hypothetical protein